jgi:plastocyanin
MIHPTIRAVLGAAAAAALLMTACGTKTTKVPTAGGAGGFDWPSAKGAGALTVAAAPGATVSGQVSYAGPAPGKIGATPDCGGSVPDPGLAVGADGALLDAVVWLEGATGTVTPANASITQKACAYTPHVVTVPVGSKVRIGNDDPLLHNVHGYIGQDSWFNEATQAGVSIQKTVDEKGILPLRCDVHPWMSGFILAFDHPYYARVGEDGRFSFAAPPPGKYELVVWHGQLGIKKQPVEIAAGQGATVTAQYP